MKAERNFAKWNRPYQRSYFLLAGDLAHCSRSLPSPHLGLRRLLCRLLGPLGPLGAAGHFPIQLRTALSRRRAVVHIDDGASIASSSLTSVLCLLRTPQLVAETQAGKIVFRSGAKCGVKTAPHALPAKKALAHSPTLDRYLLQPHWSYMESSLTYPQLRSLARKKTLVWYDTDGTRIRDPQAGPFWCVCEGGEGGRVPDLTKNGAHGPARTLPSILRQLRRVLPNSGEHSNGHGTSATAHSATGASNACFLWSDAAHPKSLHWSLPSGMQCSGLYLASHATV